MTTLLQYRTRLRTKLADLNVATWEDDRLDQAIREALQEFNDALPDEAISTLTFASSTRELSLATLANLLEVRRVWCPYTAASPEDPPNWRLGFELWPANILYFTDDPKPASGDVARIWWTRPHTLNGLDGATTTSIRPDHSEIITIGSASYAASQRAREMAETVNADDDAYKQTAGFAFNMLNQFRARLNDIRQKPAGRIVTLPPSRRRRVPRS